MVLTHTEGTEVKGKRLYGFIFTCAIGLVLCCVWSLTTSCAYISSKKGFGCQDYVISRNSFVSLTHETDSMLLSTSAITIDSDDYLKENCQLKLYRGRLVNRLDVNANINTYFTEKIRVQCNYNTAQVFTTQDSLNTQEPSSGALAKTIFDNCGVSFEAMQWNGTSAGPVLYYAGRDSSSEDMGAVIMDNQRYLACTNTTALGEAVRSKFAENAFNIGFQCSNCLSMGIQGRYGLGELQKTLVGTLGVFGSLYTALSFAWLYTYKPPQRNEAESSLLPEDEQIRLDNDNKT